jgi:NAD(P)H-flavin reductase
MQLNYKLQMYTVMQLPGNVIGGSGQLDFIVPEFLPIEHRIEETADVVSLVLPVKQTKSVQSNFQPGQFNMLYAFGVGEVPISISGDPALPDHLVHTIRGVGPVSDALLRLKRGEPVGVRGPFGIGWPVAEALASDVLVIAGGIGLAPLRPALYHLLNERSRYGRVALLYGARSPAELIFSQELDSWRRTPGIQVRVTVDHANSDWVGDVGVATRLLPKIQFDPIDTIAMICGPEVMIRFTAAALEAMGVAAERIYVSMERNMKCAMGSCGHCQFGPHFICKDGPVFRLDHIRGILSVREI